MKRTKPRSERPSNDWRRSAASRPAPTNSTATWKASSRVPASGLRCSPSLKTVWKDLGFRDAIFAMQRQDDVYASQCEPRGVKVDVARYAQGWKEGKWEADSRRSESVD